MSNVNLGASSSSELSLNNVSTIPDPNQSHSKNETKEDWDSWDPMAEDYSSSRNTLSLDPDKDPLTTITGKVRPISSKIGNVTICDHYAKYGECADGDYCDRIHVDPRARDKIWTLQNTYETNKNRACMNFTYLSPQEFTPDPEALLLVSVTSAKSPVNFYFVAPYELMNFKQYSSDDLEFYIDRVQQTSTAKTKLQKCHEQLALLFEHSYRIDNLNDEIYLSQIVACKLKDGRYRRAMVIDTPNLFEDKFNYTLLLLDVGTEVELPRELIYDIKAYCLSEPPMAVNCRLAVKPPNGETRWSQEAMNFFEEKARGKKYLLCKILDYIKYDRIYTVDLYHPIFRRSLTESMINKGLAEKCEY